MQAAHRVGVLRLDSTFELVRVLLCATHSASVAVVIKLCRTSARIEIMRRERNCMVATRQWQRDRQRSNLKRK